MSAGTQVRGIAGQPWVGVKLIDKKEEEDEFEVSRTSILVRQRLEHGNDANGVLLLGVSKELRELWGRGWAEGLGTDVDQEADVLRTEGSGRGMCLEGLHAEDAAVCNDVVVEVRGVD